MHNDKNCCNKSIACTVTSCANHNQKENYCTLNTVNVGTHETDPCQCQCVDCMSFKKK